MKREQKKFEKLETAFLNVMDCFDSEKEHVTYEADAVDVNGKAYTRSYNVERSMEIVEEKLEELKNVFDQYKEVRNSSHK